MIDDISVQYEDPDSGLDSELPEGDFDVCIDIIVDSDAPETQVPVETEPVTPIKKVSLPTQLVEPNLDPHPIKIEQFDCKYHCEEIIRGMKDWEKMRSCLLDAVIASSFENQVEEYVANVVAKLKPDHITEFLLLLVSWREKYVNHLLKQLTVIFHGNLLIENEAGSRDPESDYDITFASGDGTICDIEAIIMFNDFFHCYWNKPSGIVLDSNVYPRCFVVVEPKFELQGGTGIFLDKPHPNPKFFFDDVNNYKANRSAILVQRRYMKGTEWAQYVTMTCNNFDGEANINMHSFYRNAELTYWKYMKEFFETMPLESDEVQDLIENGLKYICDAIKDELADTTGFEKLTKTLWKEHNSAMVKHSNFLLMKVYREAKEIEISIRKIEDLYDRSFWRPILRKPIWHQKRLDAMSVYLRHKVTKCMFYANDGYLSEGTRFHCGVEQYNNAADPGYVKDKQMMLNSVTNNQLWQAINENYGDMLKDIYSYIGKNAAPGRVLYRSGKYMYRVLNAEAELGLKKITRMGIEGSNPDIQGPRDLKKLVQQLLLPIRKLKPPFDKMNAHQRAEMAILIAETIFATEERLQHYWEERRHSLSENSRLYRRRQSDWKNLASEKSRRKLTVIVKNLLIDDLKSEIDTESQTPIIDSPPPSAPVESPPTSPVFTPPPLLRTASYERRNSLPHISPRSSPEPSPPTTPVEPITISELKMDTTAYEIALAKKRLSPLRRTSMYSRTRFRPPTVDESPPASPIGGTPPKRAAFDFSRLEMSSPKNDDSELVERRLSIVSNTTTGSNGSDTPLISDTKRKPSRLQIVHNSPTDSPGDYESPTPLVTSFDPADQYAIVSEIAASVRNTVIFNNSQINKIHVAGILDYIPSWILYLFDWNRATFHVTTQCNREEYHIYKNMPPLKKLDGYDYFFGILLGIITLLVQIFIMAPIQFILKPLKEGNRIAVRALLLVRPMHRHCLQWRAAYQTAVTTQLVVPHDNRMINTRVTLTDAYGVTYGTRIIGFMRLLNLVGVDMMIWFSWVAMILTIISVGSEVEFVQLSVNVLRNCSILCTFVALSMCIILNTWTTIRRYVLVTQARDDRTSLAEFFFLDDYFLNTCCRLLKVRIKRQER
jgi:hypothetical protein